MKIYFHDCKWTLKWKIKRLFAIAMRYLNQTTDCEVQFSLVNSDEIKQLNWDSRGIDDVTDVLSFPMLELTAGDVFTEGDINPDTGRIMLGDIVLCYDVAEKQARWYSSNTTSEVCFLALHSLLHLLGYDHAEPEEKQLMDSTAMKIMLKAGIK